MLAVNGYYNGSNIVLDDEVELVKGQRLLVILETSGGAGSKIDFDKYVMPTERGKHVERYMEEMRADDRI